MSKDKIFLFLILVLIVAAFTCPVRQFLSNGIISDLSQKDMIAKKQPIYSKGIYITFITAGSPRIDELLDLVKRTELNTVVIDIKDYTGRIGFDTNSQLINEIGSEQIWIKDIEWLIKKFHCSGIYVIARICVFEDNFLPRKKPDSALKTRTGNLWQDFKGLTWLDPASKEVWDYNLELAKEAVKVGFDEINLDYVRFPSDGNIELIVYPFWDRETSKPEVIRQFFEYFSQKMKPLGVFISIDLFGLTLTSNTDMNIGQWLENAAPYFDYICPMVYPSHYPEGFEGFANPALYPYEVIYKGLTSGMERIASISAPAKLRPWLQDFNLGADYTPEMIRLEKQAVYDAGAFGWLLWNSKNIYTEEALLKAEDISP
jgi:hypothetical protein